MRSVSKIKRRSSNYIECPTNAGKFISTLRHSTTTTIAAITDIVDNSVDALADVVNIRTFWKKGVIRKKTNHSQDSSGPKKIIISDNGCGMDYNSLIEAFKLGSISDKGSSSDLGCFGIGLKQSALSFCRKFSIISRFSGGDTLVGVYDIGHIAKVNKFEVDIHVADSAESSLFEKEMSLINTMSNCPRALASSGTIIIFEDIDRFVWKSEGPFINNLTTHQPSGNSRKDACLGETFRKYISSGALKIVVNKEVVKSYDPVRDHELICPIAQEVLKTDSGTITFHIAELQTGSTRESSEKGVGFYTRGFYVVRNGRQIMRGQDLGILPNKNNVNNLRIEMIFNSDIDYFSRERSMDHLLSVSNDKCHIDVDDNLKGKIRDIISPYIKRCESNNNNKIKIKKEEKLITQEAEKKIAKRSHMFEPIRGVKEKREKRKVSDTKNRSKNIPSKSLSGRTPKKSQDIKHCREQAQFCSASYGQNGPVFGDPEWTNDNKIKIPLNRDHPCYNFICEAGALDIENPMLLMAYANAREELRANDSGNDATFETIMNFRYDVGKVLATLMR